MFDLNNKSILVTGGSRGIGLATSLLFAKAGANVAFTYHQAETAAMHALQAIEACGVKGKSFRVENRAEEGYESLVNEIVSDWGTLDVAVANSGIWEEAALEEMTIEEFERTMSINMTGTFILAKHAARVMKQGSSLVIVSSTAGQRGEFRHSHYAASKGAQISFTKSLAVELAPKGIRVNSVAPGWVDTDMTRRALDEPGTLASIKRSMPLGRPGKPEEIANAIVFLASPLASFITGEILNVNGGSVLCG